MPPSTESKKNAAGASGALVYHSRLRERSTRGHTTWIVRSVLPSGSKSRLTSPDVSRRALTLEPKIYCWHDRCAPVRHNTLIQREFSDRLGRQVRPAPGRSEHPYVGDREAPLIPARDEHMCTVWRTASNSRRRCHHDCDSPTHRIASGRRQACAGHPSSPRDEYASSGGAASSVETAPQSPDRKAHNGLQARHEVRGAAPVQ